jgi:hypothetical protein
MSRKRSVSSAVGALVAAAVAGGVAYATIPGPDNVYSACMLKGVGTIRLIDKSLPSTNLMSRCTDKEAEISWNQAGQPGPQGVKGEPGAPGTNGTNGTAGRDGVSVTTATARPPRSRTVRARRRHAAHEGSKELRHGGAAWAREGGA